ncbi:MAG: polyprenyl synthetase, partial [SAR324 cluster bacterium]|nr:polyprenyl synthetase [SAR324 cluster bacterium]
MKQAACDKDLLDIENDIERIQTAIKNKLGVLNPFLADIAHHIITPHNNSTRSMLLLQSANLFKKPDEDVIDIGSTLEYLHTAS